MSSNNLKFRLAYFLRGFASRAPISWWDISRVALSATTLCLAIYFMVSAGVGIWQWTITARNSDIAYHERANQYRQEAADQLAQRCAVPSAPRDIVVLCLSEQIERYRESNTTDEDLAAQQEMARWTVVMGIVAVLGVPLSFAGLIALWFTLRQTRQAITNDREIGEAQVRAYIAVEPKQPSSITSDKVITSDFDFRNTGQSPARSVRYVAGIIIAPYPLPDSQGDLFSAAEGQPTPKLTIAPGPPTTGEAIAPEKFTPEQIREAMGGGATRLYMGGIIWYEDVFRVKRQTRFCFYLDQSDEPAPPREHSMGLRVYNWHQAHVHNDED